MSEHETLDTLVALVPQMQGELRARRSKLDLLLAMIRIIIGTYHYKRPPRERAVIGAGSASQFGKSGRHER